MPALRGASVKGLAGWRADAEGGHGGDRKAHDGRARPLFSRKSVQGLAADRRHERRLASGVFQARVTEAVKGRTASRQSPQFFMPHVRVLPFRTLHEAPTLPTGRENAAILFYGLGARRVVALASRVVVGDQPH